MEATIKNLENQPVKKVSTKAAAIVGAALLGMILLVGIFYVYLTKNQIYTDKAVLEAPIINISALQSGTLQKMLVKNGDLVAQETPVAQVAEQVLRSEQAGLIILAENQTGKSVKAGETIVSLIKPEELRVIAHVDEDKGFQQIEVGQLVNFSVDAFAGKKYVGRVEEVSPTSREAGVVFNISDKRETKQFDVKIKFDWEKYPELKNGMSAKVTIFVK